ncbi:glycosyltransferase [Caldichromatium japonicum]|uniref:Glycosyltransferase n=1 Tax=Caldichromatium japonicum TaxID=2699430 RepID=A0A6G7VA20_9GAMM|nr:glycosyltransferase [Caldichromatium japonicum]
MLYLVSLFIAGLLIALAALPLDQGAQIQFSVALLAFLVLLRPLIYGRLPFDNRQRFLRILFVLLALLLSIRYFCWRTFETLLFANPLSLVPGLILYGAELFAFTVLLIGAFVYIQPLNRPVLPMPKDRSRWPTVDVLVQTYDEPDSVIELTLLGALAIDYPADRIKIWLLDDGATRAKRTQPDPEKARAACERGRCLRKLCAQLGVNYLTRERNESAKAGNINHALQYL